MGWLKPGIKVVETGLYRNKDLNQPLRCPWDAYCPAFNHISHLPDGTIRVVKRAVPLKQKIKLVENTQPMVRLYECQYCGCRFYYGIEGPRIPEEQKAHLKNPSFIGGRKVI